MDIKHSAEYYMKILLSLIILLMPTICISQTTIYSESYPNGIVTASYEAKSSKYVIRPIDNPSLEITIRRHYTDVKPNLTDKEIHIMEQTVIANSGVLESNPRTGKIYYSDVVNFEGVSRGNLYRVYKQLPQGLIQYELVSEDKDEHSFQKYQGFFQAKFAGDQYFIIFNLTVWFKDGRIKYEFSNFTTGFSENKSKPNWWGYGGTSTNINHYKTLDQLYSRDSRYGDRYHYWIPVAKRIAESIDVIRTQGSNNVIEEDW